MLARKGGGGWFADPPASPQLQHYVLVLQLTPRSIFRTLIWPFPKNIPSSHHDPLTGRFTARLIRSCQCPSIARKPPPLFEADSSIVPPRFGFGWLGSRSATWHIDWTTLVYCLPPRARADLSFSSACKVEVSIGRTWPWRLPCWSATLFYSTRRRWRDAVMLIEKLFSNSITGGRVRVGFFPWGIDPCSSTV